MASPRKLLEYDLKHALAALPRTAPRNYQERRLFLRALANDLSTLKYPISSLKEVSSPIVKDLIQLWKKRGNTSQTIQVKLSRLRVLGCQSIPPTATLGLAHKSSLQGLIQKSKDRHWEEIEPNDLRIYARLQYDLRVQSSRGEVFTFWSKK